ncbi:MAG: hypothetical protein RL148_2965 [Planctomycetota bacterium]|jgi:predicted dehydrogenase
MATTRRRFLRDSALTGAALSLASCSVARRAPKPLDAKLRLGVIGVGGRGWDNFSGVLGQDIVAICDVDARFLERAAGKVPNAQKYRDFRELIARPDLDGVVVSTPDHTHYPAAKLALDRGLDVYCEKPLTHTVKQARRLRETAERNGCITQMGTQIHSLPNYRRVVEMVQAGVLGTVREVHVFVNGTDWSSQGRANPEPVPEFLEWKLWAGPALEPLYSPAYHPAGWRRFWDFGGGTTADMGCHYMDLAFWALDLRHPESVQADGTVMEDGGTPKGLHCAYRFPAGRNREALGLTWWAGSARPKEQLESRGIDWSNGVLFVGDKGWLVADYTRNVLGPKDAFVDFTPPPKTIADSIGHYEEWILACKTREPATALCNFGYGGVLTEAVLLANVAFRGARGEKLLWRPESMELIGANKAGDQDPGRAAMKFLDVKQQPGWPA